nr:S-layer homology domain-containing protein [Acidimicrobiales bacterium]
TPTNYDVEYSPDGFVFTSKLFWHADSTATTIEVTGLTNGTVYTFRVSGVNGDGTSAASATATATPASQNTPNDLAVFDACPASLITSAGFDDTNSPDVACIKHYGITMGTTATTFSPVDPVTRWQMALFLTRMVGPAGGVLPSGADQGFTDISGKDDEQQLAINQLKQMGITIGKTLTPLTYAPDQYVTREEMSLFIERLLKAVTAGPGGNVELVSANGTATEIKSVDTDHNFTDINTVSIMDMQNAIINLWNLGVTEVATATLYEPSVNISRLNMAQMMARALDHTNARPAGLSIQASRYLSAAAGLSISVTHRTADFLPVVGSLVDTFRYLQTDTFGYSEFSSDGSCAQVVVTEVSSTLCYIDTAEKVTDAYGNITPFISATISGSVWEYYVWTAAAGTTYDNDVHGTGTVTMTVRG